MKSSVELWVIPVALASVTMFALITCAVPRSNPSSIEVVDHSVPTVSQPAQQPSQEKQPCG